MPDAVLPPVRTVFRAVVETCVPEASALDAVGWAEAEAIVEQALAMRPPKVRRQLAILLRLVNVLPAMRFGRTFAALDPERRLRVLRSLQDAPVLLLRRGIWGLRTLAFMGYYARPAGSLAVGYRAQARGWEARR